MAVHDNFPAGVLITNGLGHNACSGSLVVAWNFRVFGCGFELPKDTADGGGGAFPLRPGEIANLYQPVDSEFKGQTTPPFYVPSTIDLSKPPKSLVIVKVKILDKEFEKEYLVQEKSKKRLIKIANLMNVTQEKIHVKINNIKMKIHSILVRIKKIMVNK